ncbi:hypothetical protein DAPPUDRAFT_252437 [Daphnia pulex]|uniref:Uncharacterized protein n=1 Tax=Daphnia pulex TaxID=6669 RepID=E9H2P2_DAPPU|nr:hypothetical protein DAPPUDRAFT_252437 [Daphnia pulex]|eukprot:EFX74026.1 hypothetical protein DAPPUDRAFT_252437 [Daphnia pulex]
MKKFPFDEETFSTLPDNEESPDVYLVDQKDLRKLSDGDPGKGNLSNTKTFASGGDSLLRSAEEERDFLMIFRIVTIREKYDPNQNSTGADHLPPSATKSFQPSTNTLVVRPAQQFVSDSDLDYLETHYPDLIPFGRSGFSEERKIPISKKTLIAYFTNLSTRKFQQPDFAGHDRPQLFLQHGFSSSQFTFPRYQRRRRRDPLRRSVF